MMNSRRRISPLPRARLVALLDREVVEHLRQLPVALQLARVERERLLVRHRQHVARAPLRSLSAEDLRDVVAAGLLPELDRRQHRHQHLLAADRVHLLADDLLDLPVHAPAERQERPDARAHLADEAAADEQLVVDRLGVGGRVAQGRQEELGGAGDHRCLPGYRRASDGEARYSSGIADASAIASAAGFAILSRFGRSMPSAIQRSISWKSSSTRMSLETFFSTRPCA